MMSTTPAQKESVFSSDVKVIPLFIAARSTNAAWEPSRQKTITRDKLRLFISAIFLPPTYFKVSATVEWWEAWFKQVSVRWGHLRLFIFSYFWLFCHSTDGLTLNITHGDTQKLILIWGPSFLRMNLKIPTEELSFCVDCSGTCGQKWYCLPS